MAYKCVDALRAPRYLRIDGSGFGRRLGSEGRLKHPLAALESLGRLRPAPELRVALHELPVETLGEVVGFEHPLEKLHRARRLRGLPVAARLAGRAQEA